MIKEAEQKKMKAILKRGCHRKRKSILDRFGEKLKEFLDNA